MCVLFFVFHYLVLCSSVRQWQERDRLQPLVLRLYVQELQWNLRIRLRLSGSQYDKRWVSIQ